MSEEHSKNHTKKPKTSVKKTAVITKKFALIIVSILVLSAAGFIIFNNFNNAVENTHTFNDSPVPNNFEDEKPPSGKIANFTGEEFRDLYNDFAYPNTAYIAEDATIFSDPEVDAHIRKVAVDRGYERRSAPVADTFVEVEPNMLLQQRAAEPWVKLKENAAKEGIDLYLTAAYRSAEAQRTIFINRLSDINLTEELIATKQFDDKLNEILAKTAVPGYSRHHTGYTIDIGCGNSPEVEFEFTVCFSWLSKKNYLKAKQQGWIPSYPENAGEQGPEPESWEYVWVGIDAVSE